MDWLLAPIDPSRAHEVGFAVSWHARSMVVAWGILAPLAILIARFFKVIPGQDWPREVDNLVWWRTHWIGQSVVLALTALGLALVWPFNLGAMTLHNWLGLVLIGFLGMQVLLGIFRGSKGGPTAPEMRGHHYDMTPWRHSFEALHKTLGYAALVLAMVVIVTGLWKANAPVWMWVALALWWSGLILAFVVLQRRGMAIDTYQAIWGADPGHPGNQLPHPGWGVRRWTETEGKKNVRSDRGNRVRSH
ncbi:MAG: cytochrome b561 domain-containing protein [Pseudomonadota bacterium]